MPCFGKIISLMRLTFRFALDFTVSHRLNWEKLVLSLVVNVIFKM